MVVIKAFQMLYEFICKTLFTDKAGSRTVRVKPRKSSDIKQIQNPTQNVVKWQGRVTIPEIRCSKKSRGLNKAKTWQGYSLVSLPTTHSSDLTNITDKP